MKFQKYEQPPNHSVTSKANLNEWLLTQVGRDMALIELGLHRNNEQKEPIVLSLTLAGLWKVLTGIGALVAGAFTLGIYYQSDATKVQLEKKNIEVSRLEATIEGLQKTCPVSRTKEGFFAVYSRLSLKKKEAARFPSNKKLQKEVKNTEKQLAMFLEENVNKKVDDSGTAIISVAFDIKDSKDSKIQFRGEQETYEVPQNVKNLTKNITWNNAPQENVPAIVKVLM